MGLLTKVIVILVLVLFITGQFTRSKAKRMERRAKLTNLLLAVLIFMVAVSLVTQFVK